MIVRKLLDRFLGFRVPFRVVLIWLIYMFYNLVNYQNIELSTETKYQLKLTVASFMGNPVYLYIYSRK